MKTQIKLALVIMIFMICLKSSAQNSSFKIGGNLNVDYVSHQGSHPENKINYPSFEVAFEKPLTNKWSFSLGFNYAKRKYPVDQVGYQYTNYDKIIILEGRYYFNSTNVGPFIQLGVPIVFTDQKVYWTDGTSTFQGSNPTDVAMNVFAGFGIKYPITPKWGVEANVSVSGPFNFFNADYGTGGFIKGGVKLTYTLNKHKAKKD